MRAFCTSIGFLVFITFTIWGCGVYGTHRFNDINWVNGARILAALPILVLFNRRVFRLWGSEDITPTYKIQDAGVHWKSGDRLDRATYKLRQYIQQLADGYAKRIGILLTVFGVFYYFLAPYLIT